MKGVQCYELFGGIALKNHAFSFFFQECNVNNNVLTTYRCNINTNISNNASVVLYNK